jgi:hypothetical protein
MIMGCVNPIYVRIIVYVKLNMLECDLQANASANFREGDKERNQDWFPNDVNRSHTFPLTAP